MAMARYYYKRVNSSLKLALHSCVTRLFRWKVTVTSCKQDETKATFSGECTVAWHMSAGWKGVSAKIGREKIGSCLEKMGWDLKMRIGGDKCIFLPVDLRRGGGGSRGIPRSTRVKNS